jgi:hypothetical protein
MKIINNIVFALIFALIVFLLLKLIHTVCLNILYGSGYAKYYKRGSIKKRCIHGHDLQRNMSIKIYVDCKKRFFEGRIIGFDYSNNILIRLYNNDIIIFPSRQIKKDDIVYALK